MKYSFLAAIILGFCGSIAFAQWQTQTIGTQADFRGLCVVSPNVAWVSGTKGTFARTTDGGITWSVGTVPGAEKHVSLDNGATWKLLDREAYNSVGFTATGEGWAVGPQGRIAKFVK